MRRTARALRARTMDARGRRLRVPGLAAWLSGVAPARARGAVNIALVTDAQIRALNRQFRRQDAVTDVLSFSDDAGSGLKAQGSRLKAQGSGTTAHGPRPKAHGPRPKAQGPPPILLGDIVIARSVARRQARMAGHSELTELRILALHGLLHLMGYDHHGESQSMARLEKRLRRKGGLREGLIERAHRQ